MVYVTVPVSSCNLDTCMHVMNVGEFSHKEDINNHLWLPISNTSGLSDVYCGKEDPNSKTWILQT